MKKLNFLTNLFSPAAGWQSNDVSVDRRLTVGSPSGFGSKSLLKLVSVLVLILTVGVGQMRGETFTKITSLASLTTGDYVIVGQKGASDFGRLTYGTLNSSRIPYSKHYTSAPASTITTTTADEIWHIEVSGTGDTRTITIYNAGRTKYLAPGISWSNSSSNWTAAYSSGFRFKNPSGTNYLGINTSANYWKNYASSTLYSNSTYCLTLYKAPSGYTLTFKETGGSNNGSGSAAANATSITIGTAPTPATGKMVEGYYAENTLTTKVANADGSWAANNITGWVTSGKYTKGADANLYIKWTDVVTTVTLDKGTDGTADGTATITYNATSFTSITNATKTGYHLNGYYTLASGGSKVINADGSLVSSLSGWTSSGKWVKNATEATLYAQWTIDTYDVHWKVNGNDWEGGSHGNPSTSANYNNKPSTIPTAPVSNDCDGTKVFVGWTNSEYSHASTAPTILFTTQSAALPITGNTTFHAVFANRAGSSKTYAFNITPSDFNGDGYAYNTGGTTTATATDASGATIDVDWVSSNCMLGSSKIQVKKNTGYIYNETDLGTVNSVTITKTNGTFSTWYGTSEHPTSGSQGANKGFFTVKETGNSETGYISNIAINFTKSNYTYSDYATTCCTPLGSINGSVSWSNAATAVVSWDDLAHVSSWTVKYKTHAAGEWSTAGASSASAGTRSVTISSLTPCTNYDFKIIATPDDGYCDKDQTIEDSQTHNWTVTSTEVTHATASPAIPGTTCASGFSTTITPATGYALPADITVTNATKSWTQGTGALTISSVTGNVTITITPTCVPPVIGTNPADASYYVGDSPDALSVSATLASGTLTYLWKVSTNGGSTWSDATGTNNAATYSGASLSTASVGTLKFKCIVGNSQGGCTVESGVATITVANASYFPNGKTIFIQAESTSAWTGGGCVKAWFHTAGGSETAQSTYWLFDATGGDAGKKLFATVVPATGDLPYLDIQRFAANCSDWWNKNGGCSYSDANGSNTIRSTGKHDDSSDGDYIRWNVSGVTIDLYGDPSDDDWASSLASFSDQGAGVWTATYSNYAPADAEGESQDFKAKTNYNGWIGNTGSNNNATLDGMHVGSTYNITATLNVTDHSLTMSKTFVKGTVHYDLQGHGDAIADVTNVTAGSKISAPSEPSVTGYTFGGWYKEPACTNAWNFASDVVNETMTLYAKWTANVYTITKTLTNVANAGLPASFTYTGSATTALNSTFTVNTTNFFLPSSIAVTMGGTPLTAGSDYTYNNSTGAFTFSAVITGNIVITATATAKLKSIAITTQPTTRKYFAGESFSSAGAVVTATMGDGSTKAVTASATWTPAGALSAGAGQTVTASYTENGINQTATTTIDVYSVTVNKKNEDGDALDVAGVTTTWTVGTKALAAGVGSTKYAFKQWEVTGASIGSTTSASTTLSSPTANVVVNAVFYKPVTVSWTKGGTAYGTGSPTTEVARGTQWKDLTIPTAPGDATLGACANKFMGWSNCSDLIGTGHSAPGVLFTSVSGITTAINDPIEFKAVFATENSGTWTLDYSAEDDLRNSTAWSYGNGLSYTASDGGTWVVKANKNSGMQINSGKNSSIKIPDCSGNITSIVITGSTAKTVRFSQSDYDGSSFGVIEVTGSDNYTQTLNFAGKSLTAGYIVPYTNANALTNIVVNYGATADYVTQCDANQVRVTYDANGGSTTCAGGSHDKRNDYTVCSSAPTRDYYTFTGWLCSADDEVYAASATIDDAVIDADFSLTAQWTPVNYTITYNLHGGTTAGGNPTSYNVTTATIDLADGTYGHNRFEGWYSTYNDGTGAYSDQVTSIPLGSHGDITLHAKWAARHEIVFDADGATTTIYRADDENMEDAVAGQGSVPSDPSAPSTCSTKVFVGWSESEIDDETNTRPGDLMKPAEGKVDEDKHYYAVWALRAGSPAPATYAGTGTFVKITSMSEVETDTYYVLRGIDGSTVKVMKNTISSGKVGTADDPVSENVITNPGVAIVWKLGGKKDAYTLYNQSVSKYVEITGNSTGGYALNASPTSGATYTLTIEDGHGFFFKSNYSTANSRGISIYNASEFRSYGLANAKTLELYKLPAYTYSAYSTSCCETKVNLTHNSPEHGTVEFNKSRVGTCNSDKEVSFTITPDAGYKLTGWTVNTASGYADAKTTSPAVVTNNNNSTVQNITLTFAQDANKDYDVTATFGLMTVSSWAWTYNSAAMPNPLNLYVGQSARLDVAYTPAGVDASKKTYTRTKVDAYINWVGVAQATYSTISGKASTGENTTAVTFTHADGPTTTVNVKVLPLPAVHFGDIVHNVSFDDVVATLSDNTLSPTKTTPTHADFDGSTLNTCEEQHLHLVGWIREDWPSLVTYLNGGAQPSTSDITSAGNDASGNAYFFTPGASINTQTFNGVTFYAVWAKVE